MKHLTLLLSTLIFSTPAGAEPSEAGLSKVRVKMSTALFQSHSRTDDFDGTELETDTQGLTLGGNGTRLEGAYVFNKNIDIGGILEFTSIQQDGDTGEADANTMGVYASVLYKKQLNPNIWGFGQGFVGMYTTGRETEVLGIDTDYGESFVGGGVNLGARYVVTPRIGLDLSAEYQLKKGTATANDDVIDDYTITETQLGLRTGIAVRF